MILGKRIKELRAEAGLTQRALAEKLNLSCSALAMYETGKRDPDTSTLAAVAAFFRVSADYLLGLNETRIPPEHSELSSDERALLKYYRKMQAPQKDVVLKVAETISPTEAAKTTCEIE